MADLIIKNLTHVNIIFVGLSKFKKYDQSWKTSCRQIAIYYYLLGEEFVRREKHGS